MSNRKNPHVERKGAQHRKRHKRPYFSANANIVVSAHVKAGLAEIARLEGRSLSWVVTEVFRFYFGLKDETHYIGVSGQRKTPSYIRRIK